jgi:2-alkenal reductase
MGITAGGLTPAIAEAMDLPSEQAGVLVEQVDTDSPADEAGLRGSEKAATIDGQPVVIGGDVIVAIDGEQIGSMEDLGAILQDHKPGDEITLTVLRDGKEIELTLTLGERPFGP